LKQSTSKVALLKACRWCGKSQDELFKTSFVRLPFNDRLPLPVSLFPQILQAKHRIGWQWCILSSKHDWRPIEKNQRQRPPGAPASWTTISHHRVLEFEHSFLFVLVENAP